VTFVVHKELLSRCINDGGGTVNPNFVTSLIQIMKGPQFVTTT